jgi:hypothetical protein
LLHIQGDPSAKQTNKIGFCTLTYILLANAVRADDRRRRKERGNNEEHRLMEGERLLKNCTILKFHYLAEENY